MFSKQLEKSIEIAKSLELSLQKSLDQAESYGDQRIPERSKPSRPNKKRTYTESFGQRDYELERYGQEIYDHFFVISPGHAVYQK